MPFYEYRCDECDKTFEIFQSMSDDPITECPQCSSSVRRLFSANSIIFKGSGFYSTDTKAKPAATKEASTAPAATPSK
jgi:putative FmdB family regulatory protein